MLDPGLDSLERMKMNPTHSPRILALDAAGAACSAALWVNGGVAARRWEAMERGHAEVLMPMAAEVVGEAGFEALDLVAVTVGPGAYTGLRIAIAAARGVGLAVDVPVLGISSFDLHRRMARDAGIAGVLAVVLETKRADVYVQLFDRDDAALGVPTVAPVPEVEDLVARAEVTLAGDAAERLMQNASRPDTRSLPVVPQLADAAIAAALAGDAFAAGMEPDLPPVRPLYLRPPDTTPPSADRQRLRP